jgi:hypothetical protein
MAGLDVRKAAGVPLPTTLSMACFLTALLALFVCAVLRGLGLGTALGWPEGPIVACLTLVHAGAVLGAVGAMRDRRADAFRWGPFWANLAPAAVAWAILAFVLFVLPMD